jgi:transcriptional regulator with XRE-family HTH domain
MKSAHILGTTEAIVARVVREARLAKGMSQEALAAEAGLHRTYISLLERGRRSPTVNTLGRISTALGLQPAILFGQISVALALGDVDNPDKETTTKGVPSDEKAHSAESI